MIPQAFEKKTGRKINDFRALIAHERRHNTLVTYATHCTGKELEWHHIPVSFTDGSLGPEEGVHRTACFTSLVFTACCTRRTPAAYQRVHTIEALPLLH
jgi:hypothetical protein